MSQQPQISPDGKFYWDGQRWVPMATKGVGCGRWIWRLVLLIIVLAAALVLWHPPPPR